MSNESNKKKGVPKMPDHPPMPESNKSKGVEDILKQIENEWSCWIQDPKERRVAIESMKEYGNRRLSASHPSSEGVEPALKDKPAPVTGFPPDNEIEAALNNMERAVRCLAVELPESVHADVTKRWQAVKDAVSHATPQQSSTPSEIKCKHCGDLLFLDCEFCRQPTPSLEDGEKAMEDLVDRAAKLGQAVVDINHYKELLEVYASQFKGKNLSDGEVEEMAKRVWYKMGLPHDRGSMTMGAFTAALKEFTSLLNQKR